MNERTDLGRGTGGRNGETNELGEWKHERTNEKGRGGTRGREEGRNERANRGEGEREEGSNERTNEPTNQLTS